MSFFQIPDNCAGIEFDGLSIEDKKRLQRISELSLAEILDSKRSDMDSLLVFPSDPNSLKDQYSSPSILSFRDNVIRTGNTMGFIGIGDTTIKLHSRFGDSGRDYFLHYLLLRVLQINLFDLPYSSSFEDIFDFLTMLFPYYLKKAMRQGLLRQYVTMKHNDGAFKGVLDVNRHIRLNVPFNGKIAYNSRHFTTDNPIFSLIRLTIDKISKKKFGSTVLNSDKETQVFVREVENIMPFCDVRLTGKIISQNLRSKIHPYYSEYEALRKLCILILKNENIKYGREEDKIYGILFDGAWLWEEYMAQILNDKFIHYYKNKGNKFYLFKEHKKSFQQIIPDYVSKDGLQVGDAKYIPLDKGKDYQDERATSIYYKTITYMYRFNSCRGLLFFPFQGAEPYVSNYDILSATPSGSNGTLTKIGLAIPSEADCSEFREFASRMRENEQQFLASIPD